MENNIRRVVTANNLAGSSFIVNDEFLSPVGIPNEPPQIKITEIWHTEATFNNQKENSMTFKEFTRDLLPGQTRFGILSMPPLKDLLAYQIALGNPVHNIKQFRMHKTNTIDYVTIMSGQVTLVLDNGEEALLHSGDVVVQQNTMHSWHNHAYEPCIMSVVQIGIQTTRNSI